MRETYLGNVQEYGPNVEWDSFNALGVARHASGNYRQIWYNETLSQRSGLLR